MIPVVVDFSDESRNRPGWVEFFRRGDTIMIRQSLRRTEQWENDAVQTVYVPRDVLLEYMFQVRM